MMTMNETLSFSAQNAVQRFSVCVVVCGFSSHLWHGQERRSVLALQKEKLGAEASCFAQI